jgi:hypothetical protein
VTAAAAAAASDRREEEEEEMTPYSSKDLAENWEFKILRSAAGKFRDPVSLQAILQEEGRAGWTLIEKFDDYRVRLKRPAGVPPSAAMLGFDPYRSYVGTNATRLALGIAAAGFAVAAMLVGFLFLVSLRAHGGH